MTEASCLSPAISTHGKDRRGAWPYRFDIASDYASVAERWSALAREGSAFAFQGETWLASWYASLGCEPDVSPLPVTIVDARTGRDLMGLPLVRRNVHGLRVVEFADGGLTDYNAPILGQDAPIDPAGAARLWRTLRAHLPEADAVSFLKMPLTIGGRANPFALLPAARPSKLNGNILHVPGEWADWHWGLEKTFRKELERSARVFDKHPEARFLKVTQGDEAVRIFAELKRLQSARIRKQGLHYSLDDPGNERFYDDLLLSGLANGRTILTALTVGETLVAAMLGMADGRHFSMVRLATAGRAWNFCSPGRLIIERTMKTLHAEGFRAFDFTIGDYAYKRRLGATNVPLRELEIALTWRATPHVQIRNIKAKIRNSPRLMALVARLRRR